MRYRYYTAGNKTICVSSYAGKKVRGIAKCSPEDQFDAEYGRKLAQLRCDEKVAQLRLNYANKRYLDAEAAYEKAAKQVEKMDAFTVDARCQLKEIRRALENMNHTTLDSMA